MATDDRTESATPRRRQEARRKGQVAKSTELTSIIVFLVAVWALHSALGSGMWEQIARLTQTTFGHAGDPTITPGQLTTTVNQVGLTLLRALGPFLLLLMVVGIVSNIAQVGVLFTNQPLVPDLNRINPMAGFQRLLSQRGLVDTLKNLLKITLIGIIAYSTFWASYPALLTISRTDFGTTLGIIGDTAYRLAMRTGFTLLVIAALDYGYQRYAYEKSIRMTKDEIKQELRQTEGSPLIKTRIRQLQRQIARRRMMQDVPKADVVITNPTHYAVALKYQGTGLPAPCVVAKGRNIIAERIKEIARENRVPIVENAPLARALYHQVEIGKIIPPDLYAAVAGILAYVYQVNNRRRTLSGAGR